MRLKPEEIAEAQRLFFEEHWTRKVIARHLKRHRATIENLFVSPEKKRRRSEKRPQKPCATSYCPNLSWSRKGLCKSCHYIQLYKTGRKHNSSPNSTRNNEIIKLHDLGLGQKAIAHQLELTPGVVAGVLYRHYEGLEHIPSTMERLDTLEQKFNRVVGIWS